MLRSLRHRILPGEEAELRQIAEQADHPVHQADVDQPAAPGGMALMQGGEDGDRPVDAADQIAQRCLRSSEFGISL